jgi:hypothetical protein
MSPQNFTTYEELLWLIPAILTAIYLFSTWMSHFKIFREINSETLENVIKTLIKFQTGRYKIKVIHNNTSETQA